ncbi:AAA family ATPase [Niabella aurantiaca]|uniref:AAA family ATPase n=1 Tax=Niabella aurantiaca TaxID=379900 RepID=UPI00035F4665|nr:AAA family ATPase [Niabella aurantiaca]
MEKATQSKLVVRDLKVHCSDEWMADGTKKYRRVFDRYELRFIYVEFSFFNKLFDEEDWEINLTLECTVKTTNPIKLCSLPQTRKVSKTENIVYIRESWGSPVPGDFWKMGDFRWDVIIDNTVAAETVFHVEDLGPDALARNAYLAVESVKLFESEADIKEGAGRKNYKVFKRAETRYVCAEVIFRNRSEKGFYAELFFHYLDNAGLLKGKSSELVYVKPGTPGQPYTVTSGWGNNTPGMWNSHEYSLEVYFMETRLASRAFQMGEQWVEWNETDSGQPGAGAAKPPPAIQSDGTFQEPQTILQERLAELNALTGLANIKIDVNEIVTLVKFYRETGRDFLNKFSLHSVFTGNPGTGKTTVARLLASIYNALGILEKGHLVEVDRETLVAGFIGQTAIKTKAKLDEALGGILFIDEAYSLAGTELSDNDFGSEAIATILKYMEDNRGKIGIIVAGYPHNMQAFIESNPGLRSRFDKYFPFMDYTPEELWSIARLMFDSEKVSPDEAASLHLKNYLKWLFENRDENFGNARTVRNIAAECVKNQNLRLAVIPKESRTAEMLSTIILDDVKEFDINEPDRWGEDRRPNRIGFRQSAT